MSITAIFILGLVLVVGVGLMLFVPLALNNYANRYDADKALFDQIDWDALRDEELQSYLPARKIEAIKRYRELSGLGLRDSKFAIDYIVEHPERLKKRSVSQVEDAGAGVRDLVEEGRYEEAEKVYAAFMGVDVFTAKEAIVGIRRDINAEQSLRDDTETSEGIHELLSAGRKIEAIKLYMVEADVDLATAKRAIDELS
ncbi:MAG: hypothetical protein AAFV98_01235 [Chloroflexota bacterium]